MPAAPSKSTYVINDKGQWLNADAAASYLRMLAAGCPSGGISAKGAGRTFDEQKALYKAYLAGKGNLAARPGTSLHEKGNALDVSRGTAAQLWMAAGGDPYNAKASEKIRANAYGWERTVNRQGPKNEPWHFAYTRAKDTKRAADLKARLKALGFADVKALQRAHKLTADGIDGPLTWAVLLTAKPAPAPAPKPDPAPAPSAVDFQVAACNAQLARFGGGAAAADAAVIKEILRPSILLAQEVDEDARTAIIGKGTLTKTYPLGTTALLWDDRKYRHGSRLQVPLGTAYHGMIGTELVSVKNGSRMVAASVHVRPNDAIKGSDAQKLAGKLADVRKILAALAKHPNVIVGGDWSTGSHRALLEAAGYRLVTPWADTYDKAGVQHLDAIYVRGPLLTARTAGSIHPTAASDHHGVVANLTLKPTPAPTT